MHEGLIGTHQRSATPYGLPFLEIGGLQLSYPSYLRTGKATDFKFGGYIYRANRNKSSFCSFQFWRKASVDVSRDSPNFFGYPLLSQERVKLRTSNLADTFKGPIRIKPIKNFGVNGAWAYPGTAQTFLGNPCYLRNR